MTVVWEGRAMTGKRHAEWGAGVKHSFRVWVLQKRHFMKSQKLYYHFPGHTLYLRAVPLWDGQAWVHFLGWWLTEEDPAYYGWGHPWAGGPVFYKKAGWGGYRNKPVSSLPSQLLQQLLSSDSSPVYIPCLDSLNDVDIKTKQTFSSQCCFGHSVSSQQREPYLRYTCCKSLHVQHSESHSGGEQTE